MKYSESLKKNRDFQLVYREGTSYANRHLVMYVRGKPAGQKPDRHFGQQKSGKQCGAPSSDPSDPGRVPPAGRIISYWL